MHQCSPLTLDGDHSVLEMLLNSLFDGSYSLEEYGLEGTNGHLEYRYMKTPLGFTMGVRMISLSKPSTPIKLSYASPRRFKINRKLLANPELQAMIDVSELE